MAENRQKLTPKEQFYTDLAAAQAEIPHVGKNSTNPHYRSAYASLEDLTPPILKWLGRHGFSFVSRPLIRDEGELDLVRAALLHKGGHSIDAEFRLPRGNPQQVGSAITYARRYLLCALTGIAPGGDDDDGNAAMTATLPPTVREIQKQIDSAKTREQLSGIHTRLRDTGALTDELRAALNDRLNAIQRGEQNG